MLMTEESTNLKVNPRKVREAEIELEEKKLDLEAATSLLDRLLAANEGVSSRELEEAAFAVKKLKLEVERYSLRLEMARLGEDPAE